jgi:hypothetical protein
MFKMIKVKRWRGKIVKGRKRGGKEGMRKNNLPFY